MAGRMKGETDVRLKVEVVLRRGSVPLQETHGTVSFLYGLSELQQINRPWVEGGIYLALASRVRGGRLGSSYNMPSLPVKL